MARNMDCRCLCHGTDGNYIGDVYFSCKCCYSAMHMHNLPRNPEARQKAASAATKTRKPRAPKPTVTTPTGTVEAVSAAVVKVGAAMIMDNIANAAREIKDGK